MSSASSERSDILITGGSGIPRPAVALAKEEVPPSGTMLKSISVYCKLTTAYFRNLPYPVQREKAEVSGHA